MIYKKGSHPILKAQLKEVKLFGNDRFDNYASREFAAHYPPSALGQIVCDDTIALLKLKNVQPHTDPFIVNKPNMASISKRESVFWLLKSRGPIYFQCGNDEVTLVDGDYVCFNDSKTHCVVADQVWYGAAAQSYVLKKSRQ